MAYSLEYLQGVVRRYTGWKRLQNIRIASLSDQIGRLERALETLESLEDNEIKQLEKDVKVKNTTRGLQWRGFSKDQFDYYASDAAQEAENFRKCVDKMTDDLRCEISSLKDKKDIASGNIISYNNTIRWANTLIQTIFN